VSLQHDRRPVRNAADIAAIEAEPLASHVAIGSAYEALLQAAARAPAKEAIRFFFDGHCHDPDRIAWRHRLRAALAGLRYGRGAAAPFERITFDEAARRVSQTARLFQACGVGRHDVVSLLLPNLPETLFCLWAAETVGVANPVNPLLDADIVASILAAAGTRVLVTLGDLPGSTLWQQVPRIRERVPTLQAVIIVRGRGSPDVIRYHDAIARFDASPLPRAAWPVPQHTASLFHTGGTTGLPKLVRGTHANKIANAHMLVLASPLTSDDVGLVALPLFHANAAVNALVALVLGMTTVLAGPAGFRTRGVRERFLEILARHRVSYFSAVPAMFASLLQLPPQRADLRHVRFAISAAAALPPAVALAFTARTGIPILEGYGQTEATVASCLTPWAGRAKPGSVGLRLPHVRLKTALLGDESRWVRDCATDEIGHLLVAGEHVACGYLDAAQDRELWVRDSDGRRWLRSGDLARIDADGYVWLTGRAKELIIRGGHNIDPRMIEEALQAHPAVAMAAAVGRPDAMAGELPVAYVTLAGAAGATADELAQHAQRRIPERSAWPKAVRIVDELPLTAIGKVFKPALVQRESESAFEAAVTAALAGSAGASVAVRPDARHGLVADIRVTLRRPADRAAAQAAIEAAMAPFAARHAVTFQLTR
jgi:fatty-acyl-CoA synthase